MYVIDTSCPGDESSPLSEKHAKGRGKGGGLGWEGHPIPVRYVTFQALLTSVCTSFPKASSFDRFTFPFRYRVSRIVGEKKKKKKKVGAVSCSPAFHRFAGS
jgi:hypothetical protein